MMPRLPLLLLLLPACALDNGLTGKDDPPFEGGDTGDDTAPPPPEELCNGVDDDGDGAVDEGFPDADGNGRVDCLDDTCPELAVAVAGAVDQAEGCDGVPVRDPVPDPWHARVKWSLAASPIHGYPEARHLPAVGDLDGDGRPEIAVVAAYGLDGELVVLDGATGAARWSVDGVDPYSGVAILDLDGDGAGEVLAREAYGSVIAFEADGDERWRSAEAPTFYANTTFVAADVDGDGHAEVIAEDLVLSADDGTTVLRLPTATGTYYRQAAVADLDRDGVPELYFNGAAYDPDGTRRWRAPAYDATASWPVPVQADEDPEGELVLLGAAWELYDADGAKLAGVPFGSGLSRSSGPCAADFDGDGKIEIAAADYATFAMREVDGTIAWEVAADDSSGLAACAATDLDADGQYEILYGDQDRVRILDGPTGATLLELPARPSMTTFEYPIPADIDGDGAAEVLVVESGADATTMITAYEHDGDGWAAYTATWGVHDWSPARQDDHASVPADTADAWRTSGLLRATGTAPAHGTRDLVPRLTDLCVADCTYGPAALAFTVENRGVEDAPAGVEAVVYADDGGARREVARVTLPAIPATSGIDGVVVELAPADIGAFAMVVVVDGDADGGADGAGAVDECDETNNEDALYTGC